MFGCTKKNWNSYVIKLMLDVSAVLVKVFVNQSFAEVQQTNLAIKSFNLVNLLINKKYIFSSTLNQKENWCSFVF